LFATHFHEITRLAEMYSTVTNKHVTAVTTDSTITPLYQVREGECDNSYGIHCARMVEFSDDVIEVCDSSMWHDFQLFCCRRRLSTRRNSNTRLVLNSSETTNSL
jgi:hypothetical protein